MEDTPTFPNWFEGQQYNFEEQLTRFKGQPDLRFLQIGAYTGDATVWMLDNILTDPSSHLIDIDTWEGSDEREHNSINFAKVHEYYTSRTSKYDNLHVFKAKSQHVLPNLNQEFNFIYVDGDHTEEAVYADAVASWKLLKSGGIIAFDDYLWGQDLPEHTTPKPAIDKFMDDPQGEYEVLVKSYQVWLLKK